MIYSLSASSGERAATESSHEEGGRATEVTLTAAHQFKVLQSRAAPAQLSLPLGGITISSSPRVGSPGGKSFRTN